MYIYFDVEVVIEYEGIKTSKNVRKITDTFQKQSANCCVIKNSNPLN
jgi:hypothetical protein